MYIYIYTYECFTITVRQAIALGIVECYKKSRNHLLQESNVVQAIKNHLDTFSSWKLQIQGYFFRRHPFCF